MADDRRDLDSLIAAVDARLSALLMPIARDLARLVRRAPKDATGTLSPTGRLGVARWLTAAIAALFGDSPAGADGKYAAPGTIPHLIAGATRAAARMAVGPVVADVTARLAGRPDLLAALTGGGGNRQPPPIETAKAWRDPNGRVLSERVWMAGETTRERINPILDYEIARGTTTTDLATQLEEFLTPQGAKPRTRTPYGTDGSYSARRLARNETTKTYGQATLVASQANPFVAGVRWRLSASHTDDNCSNNICATNASADPHGLGGGVYRKTEVPTYPGHVQCKCTLLPVVREDSAAVAAELGRWARGESDAPPLNADAMSAYVTGFGATGAGGVA